MKDEKVLKHEAVSPPSTGAIGANDGNDGAEVTEAAELESHGAVSSFGAASDAAVEETAYTGSENGNESSVEALEPGLEIAEGFDQSILEMDRESLIAPGDDSKLLDAYYAEFGDPVVAALLKQRPELMESIREVIIPPDDRIQVSITTYYPWRTICYLRITAGDGSQWIGTGWLAGPRLVVTAGHVVYMHSRGGWVRSIEVIPGSNGASRPFGSCNSSFFYSVLGWTRDKERNYDYGAIILPSNCKYGNSLGYFGFGAYSSSTLNGLLVNLSGYPGDKPAGTQWWHARRISSVTARTLVYNIDTAGGQSGSPVWWLRDGSRYGVGIHTNGSLSGNSATRISTPVFQNLRNWKYAHV